MSDPYYNRKPVPKEFVQDVGPTGLTPEEEYLSRERKYSANGDDVRKFSTKLLEPKTDPYYNRKRVDPSIIKGVGETGLTPEEEYLNRERKYSANGDDVRKFSGKLEPKTDPYYNRKRLDPSIIKGVGETGLTPAEEFEARERKLSVAQLSADPFDILANRPRQSIAAQGGQYAIAEQRRASQAGAGMGSLGGATASVPGQASHSAMHKPANDAHFKGYTGFGGSSETEKLAPIESKSEVPPVASVTDATTSTTTEAAAPTATTGTGTGVDAVTGHTSGHTAFYDQATDRTGKHADEIGPTDPVRNGTETTTGVA